jgi:hypothetical protein
VVKKPAAGKHYIYCIQFPHILKGIINNTSGQTTLYEVRTPHVDTVFIHP